MKPLVVIPARGGSKGLPGKNIRPLNGKPLIHYTIEAAREVFPDDRICITTDSEEIRTVARETGIPVPFLRPNYLARDTATSYDVLLHALEYYSQNGIEIDTLILLQPTSPLRKGQQVAEAIKCYSPEIDMVVSVKHTDANPYYVLKEENEQGFLVPSKTGTFTRRQDCPEVYELNGAIYVINRKSLEKSNLAGFTRTVKYVMDKMSSVDIDDLIDFELAELLVKQSK
jgi:CMP-N,N'-diacetyllegionaminic acid synthase